MHLHVIGEMNVVLHMKIMFKICEGIQNNFLKCNIATNSFAADR